MASCLCSPLDSFSHDVLNVLALHVDPVLALPSNHFLPIIRGQEFVGVVAPVFARPSAEITNNLLSLCELADGSQFSIFIVVVQVDVDDLGLGILVISKSEILALERDIERCAGGELCDSSASERRCKSRGAESAENDSG